MDKLTDDERAYVREMYRKEQYRLARVAEQNYNPNRCRNTGCTLQVPKYSHNAKCKRCKREGK